MTKAAKSRNGQQSRGITLIELLVVIGIVGILTAILLPAVQSARESARRITCVSNMRQIGLGVVQYEIAQKSYPPSNVSIEPSELHCILAFLLPYLEQNQLYTQYDFSQPWYFNGTYYNDKKPVYCKNGYVASRQIPIFCCPSSPTKKTVTYSVMPAGTYGTSDYAVCAELGIVGEARQLLLSAGIIQNEERLFGVLRPIYGEKSVMVTDETLKSTDVSDGTSYTILFTEDVGRPEYYTLDGRPSGATVEDFVTGAAWADRDSEYRITDTCFGRVMNCHNDNELFSFHPGGAVFVFLDGSVRFLSNEIQLATFAAFITPDRGETVDENQF